MQGVPAATAAPATVEGAPTLLERLGFAGLVIFVFVIPFERSIAVGAIGGLARVIGPVSVVLGIIGLYRGGRIRFRAPSLFVVAMALFVLLNAASVFWSVSTGASIRRAGTFAQLWLVVVLVWQLVRSEHRRRALLQAYVSGGWIAAGSILFGFVTGWGYDNNFRVAGFDSNANWAALAIALAIPMAWHLAITSGRRWIQWLDGLYLLAALVAIGLTASRGGLIAALLALTIVPFTFGRLGWWRSTLIVVLLVSASIAAWNILPKENVARIAAGPTELTQGDLTGRTEIWQAGLQVLPDRPLLGYGSGAYSVAVVPVLGRGIDSHNGYLAILVQLGVVGLALFVGLILLAAVPPALASRGSERVFYVVLAAVLVVALLPANFEFHKATWFILALLTTRSAVVTVPDR